MLEVRPSSAVSTAFDGSLPPRSARFGVQTPRRDTARCLDLRATAPVTERSRPRQRALQGTCRQPEPTVRGRARAPLERLGFSFELPTRARSPRHQLRWRAALRGGGEVHTLGRRLRRESRRCCCVGCQRRRVCVVWSRDFDGCNVDALPPRGGAETDRDGPLRVGRDAPRRLPSEATGLHGRFYSRPCGLLGEAFHWRRTE